MEGDIIIVGKVMRKGGRAKALLTGLEKSSAPSHKRHYSSVAMLPISINLNAMVTGSCGL